jgi:hypothetical protein
VRYLISRTNETYESIMKMAFMELYAFVKMYEADDEREKKQRSTKPGS